MNAAAHAPTVGVRAQRCVGPAPVTMSLFEDDFDQDIQAPDLTSSDEESEEEEEPAPAPAPAPARAVARAVAKPAPARAVAKVAPAPASAPRSPSDGVGVTVSASSVAELVTAVVRLGTGVHMQQPPTRRWRLVVWHRGV